MPYKVFGSLYIVDRRVLLDVEALNILWKIVPKSQETIGILILTVERGPRHHRRLEIEVEVEGARANIEDEEVQCQRQ